LRRVRSSLRRRWRTRPPTAALEKASDYGAMGLAELAGGRIVRGRKGTVGEADPTVSHLQVVLGGEYVLEDGPCSRDKEGGLGELALRAHLSSISLLGRVRSKREVSF